MPSIEARIASLERSIEPASSWFLRNQWLFVTNAERSQLIGDVSAAEKRGILTRYGCPYPDQIDVEHIFHAPGTRAVGLQSMPGADLIGNHPVQVVSFDNFTFFF